MEHFCGKYIGFITLLVTVVAVTGQKCNNLNTNGYTVPQGDIVLEYGSTLNITCNLNKNIVDEYGPNASSRLYFQRNNSPISSELVTILNSTSSTLYIENHPKTKEDNYYCYFNGTKDSQEMICMNVVKVGGAPLNVTDFSCISRNCDNFTCTWTPPENYVKTDYYLTYQIKIRQSRNKTKGICQPVPENNDWSIYQCEPITTLSNGKKSCFLNVKTTPQYRPVHECYYFQLRMNNTFGSNVNYIDINHFKHVIPNPPENLTGVATSPHSIALSWTIPMSMVTFRPGLQHRILYQCEYYEKVWQLGQIIYTGMNNKSVSYELTNLKYAHALCNVRVSMRSAVADDGDDSMWSQNATRTIRTLSKIPDRAPKINIGSFDIVDQKNERIVYVYWHQLLENEYNGENLIYIVKIRNTSICHESAKSFVVVTNLTFSENVVDIWSSNVMGQSLEKSTLVIPAKPIEKPSSFVKEHRGHTYEVSWKIPSEMESVITNYTVFWCPEEIERPVNCSGRMNWEVLPKNVTKYSKRIPATGIYQFAISANSVNNTSGMLWAECTAVTGMGRIENAWIVNAGSDYITVGWSIECSYRMSTIQGYIIEYCQTKSMEKTECRAGTEKNVTIKGDLNLKSAIVTGLTPCTSYALNIAYIINNSTFSQPSKELRNATSPAAPETPPHKVEVTEITNSSIFLSWQPPTKISCYLQQYNIYNYDIKVANTSETKINLTNLSSYTKYAIAIEACTTKCSVRSDVIKVETLKWFPGVIKMPSVSSNDSHMTIFWDKPDPPGGEISYYQLSFKDSLDTKNAPIVNVTAQNYTIEGCASGKQKHFYISVRAVNLIGTLPLEGPWSSDVSHSCASFSSVLPIIVCSSVIFFLVAMIFGSKKFYAWIKVQRAFTPKLPSGLIDNETRISEKTEVIDESPPADSQHLLKSDEIRISGESSGCSSGHESITSSLGSTTHISSSDSGTEQPSSPSLSKELRKNSLRQRVVAASRPTTNMGYVTTDTIPLDNLALKPATATPGNYCVIGVDPSSTAKSDAPYIPLIDMNTKLLLSCDLPEGPPPPYVVTGDVIKTSNPGYVPYPVTEPADKNVAYVVAGLPKDLLGPNLIQCDPPKANFGEENPHYIRAGEAVPGLKPMFHWPAPQGALPKPGYVSVGDAPPPKPLTEITKGYVPHRQYEGKSLKED